MGDLQAIIDEQTNLLDDLKADEILLDNHITEMDACYTKMCEDEEEAIEKRDRN